MSERQELAGDVFLEVLETETLMQEENPSEGNKVTLGGGAFFTLLCC